MKKVFMLLSMALLINVAFAQTSFKANENLLASLTTETPLIIDGVEWKTIDQDLGQIAQNKPFKVKYELTNRNASPLVLKKTVQVTTNVSEKPLVLKFKGEVIKTKA